MELLVASFMMMAISIVMMGLFATSKQTLVHGSNRLAIQQMARHSMNRILPYLQTVVPVTDTARPLVVEKRLPDEFGNIGAGGVGTHGQEIQFSTTHDFMAFPIPAYAPRAPIYYFYRIVFETTPKRELYLEKMQPPAPPTPPFPLPPTTPSSNLAPFSPAQKRVLTHGDKKAEAFLQSQASITLQNVKFVWVRQGEMTVHIDVRGPVRTAQKQERIVDYKLETRIQFPFYANR